ncbi:MAG: YceI family protein [Phycisphaeraceae bacterium]|nr:YceI family protein [Phycisphaeraceae bacterium]
MNKALLIVPVLSLAAAGAMLAGAGSPAAPAAPATTGSAEAFNVDPVHSTAIYRVKHLGTSYSYGRFTDISGTFLLDPENPDKSVIDVTINTESIDSGNQGRDKHLRSPDFFSAKEFPTITFKSTGVKKTGDTSFDVSGDLTLRGQTKPVTVSVDLTGTGKGMRGGELAGVESKFTVKRSDYGMTFLPEAVGDEVSLIVSLEGGRK